MVDETDKALISLGVLVGAAIVSVIIAKIVDICYDRASISDDASDISEHTRNLIRARLTVMKFRNKKEDKLAKTPIEEETQKEESVKKVFRIWSAKSKLRTRSDIEKGNNLNNDNKTLQIEDVGETSDENKTTVKEDVTHVKPIEETEKVEVINEKTVPEVVETEKEVIRPKSALKKVNPNANTATTTSGNTSFIESTSRPKSAIKRVTIAEPNSNKLRSPGSEGSSSVAPSTAGTRSTVEQDKLSVNQTESQSELSEAPVSAQGNDNLDKDTDKHEGNSIEISIPSTSSSFQKDIKTTPPPNENNSVGSSKPTLPRSPETRSLSPSTSKSNEVDMESEGASLPEAWNEAIEAIVQAPGTSGKKKRPLGKGKEGWRKTYVLYRGNSEDLLVPFSTKDKVKKKKISKPNSKPKKRGK